MIIPTIGRIVWYKPLPSEMLFQHDQHYPGIISHVWDTREVTLAIFNESGLPFQKRVVLAQDRDAVPGEAEWMTFQKDQAAKNTGS